MTKQEAKRMANDLNSNQVHALKAVVEGKKLATKGSGIKGTTLAALVRRGLIQVKVDKTGTAWAKPASGAKAVLSAC